MCWIFITYFTALVASKAQEYIKTNNRNVRVVEALVTLTIAFGKTQRPGLMGMWLCSLLLV